VLLCLSLFASACGDDRSPDPSADSGSDSDSTAEPGDTANEAETETGGELLEPICASSLSESITAEAVAAHLEALDALAKANGGNRAAGTAGYEASAAYVEAQLEGLGYVVTRWPFVFERYALLSPPTLALASDPPTIYVNDQDYGVPQWAPAGSVSAALEAVDLELGLGNHSTSGCEAEDFSSFTAGNIALLQRGSCTFAVKVAQAEAAGAVAVVMFNQGDTANRMGLFGGSLGAQNQLGIPVVFTTYALGTEFAEAAALDAVILELSVDAGVIATETFNVLAETPTGDPDQVVMLGAHLDSVPAGPGVNDNGSGTATVLELARQFAACTPHNKVRFAWWGAEEWGLHGSRLWVESLDDQALAQLAMYLNFDMVASPNYVRFVHSGQGAAAGSTLIHDAFLEWFDAHELPTSPAPFTGNSDYQPFVNAGVRAGGLATGAGGGKSQSQAETFGGVAGEPYDLCYHQACDDVANFNLEVLGHNTQAAAHVLEKWATDLGSLADAREIVTVVQDLTPDPGCGHTHE
jgi:Zn-dependent M28 family amino/carboxypeptidase